jgi:hypothetical protein
MECGFRRCPDRFGTPGETSALGNLFFLWMKGKIIHYTWREKLLNVIMSRMNMEIEKRWVMT